MEDFDSKDGLFCSYFYHDERGLFPELQFVYDLEVPSDFTPQNADGEVDSFQLVTIPEVGETCRSETSAFSSDGLSDFVEQRSGNGRVQL